jgi:hypothetical protein
MVELRIPCEEWGDGKRREARDVGCALLRELERLGYPADRIEAVRQILSEAGVLGGRA